jgi:hypothetical protein
MTPPREVPDWRRDINLRKLREMNDAMAEDDGLWFVAETASEAYLQQELRKLCAEIEKALP